MKKQEEKGPRTPIYRNAGFELETSDKTASAFISETENEHVPEQYIYSRYRNPTVVSAETAVMNVEGCKWALLAESGMAAIDIALSIFQEAGKKGKWLFSSEIYGGTLSFISSVLVNRRGIDIEFFSPAGLSFDYDRIEQQVKDTKPEVLYFEAISNPLLIVADGRRLIRIAKKYGCKVIIDNTFATPALWKPLEDGADLVIHSATKYFGGHGNITAGVICGNDRTLMQKSIEYRKFTGHMLSPDDAYRLETQLASFFLRYRQQCRNAEMIANLLTDSEKVVSVYYPGLTTHSTHQIAEALFDGNGYGAMITFDLCGANDEEKRANRDRFIERVSSEIKLVPTLGDSHTILMPVEPVWGSKYHEPGMIRLSVGFEETERLMDLISFGLK
ncbi:MAG TPA: PLP-dependent aspartate aminotransferase family protein [Bacteroidales bacterium]|nr:PLP-dependent aspartate aminotransferase family protein [Bacteroidales bacterium]HPT12008.1 PLP-dependent aspartate aminotransferase family protein [Bacteroidales bacterium]